jgi:hypothetical protein
MPPVGLEPSILAGERPQTYALDRAATGPASDSLIWENTLLFAFVQLYCSTTPNCETDRQYSTD